MSKRDEYFEKMKQQLDELNTHIGELEKKVQAGQGELESKAQEQITHLREVYAGMKARLDEIGNAGEENWNSMVSEGDKVWKAFVHSVNYFKSQLK